MTGSIPTFSFFKKRLIALVGWGIHVVYGIPCQTHSPPLALPEQSQILPTYLRLSYPGQKAFDLSDSLLTEHFHLHFNRTGSNRIDTLDSDLSGFPDYTEEIAAELEFLYELYIQKSGWNSPPLDNKGHYHVYFIDMDPSYYGYVQPDNYIIDNPQSERPEINAYDSYMVLRNSYQNFEHPEEALLATLAHEFLHSIQFAYDAWEERWLFEGQATSMEYWVYPQLTDNFQFLDIWYSQHEAPLNADAALNPNWESLNYAIWPFFHSLHERFGGLSISRAITEAGLNYNSRAIAAGQQAIDQALKESGSNWEEEIKYYALQSFGLHSQSLFIDYAMNASSDFLNYEPELSLTLDLNLNLEKPSGAYRLQKEAPLWGNGFHLIQAELSQGRTLFFDIKHHFEIVAIDTSSVLKMASAKLTPTSNSFNLDSSWTGHPIQLLIFNWGSSRQSTSYEIEWMPLNQRATQFCGSAADSISSSSTMDCGAFYDLKGHLKGRGSKELITLDPGIYFQKTGALQRSILFK